VSKQLLDRLHRKIRQRQRSILRLRHFVVRIEASSLIGVASRSHVSSAIPFLNPDAGLSQDSPNKPRIDRTPMRIGNRNAQTAPVHPLMPSSRERPFKAKALQLAHQLTP
jgi:hypothetical protein